MFDDVSSDKSTMKFAVALMVLVVMATVPEDEAQFQVGIFSWLWNCYSPVLTECFGNLLCSGKGCSE